MLVTRRLFGRCGRVAKWSTCTNSQYTAENIPMEVQGFPTLLYMRLRDYDRAAVGCGCRRKEAIRRRVAREHAIRWYRNTRPTARGCFNLKGRS